MYTPPVNSDNYTVASCGLLHEWIICRQPHLDSFVRVAPCDDAGMDEQADRAGRKLSRQEISDAVTGLGWRHILGAVRPYVRVRLLAQAADVAGRVAVVAGPGAGECLQARSPP